MRYNVANKNTDKVVDLSFTKSSDKTVSFYFY